MGIGLLGLNTVVNVISWKFVLYTAILTYFTTSFIFTSKELKKRVDEIPQEDIQLKLED